MKHIISSFLLLVTPLMAADPASHVYRGEVTGVMCSACAARVKAALSRLDGVSSVKITLGEKGTAPKIEIISTSEKLTRADAVKALGDAAKTYDVKSLKMER